MGSFHYGACSGVEVPHDQVRCVGGDACEDVGEDLCVFRDVGVGEVLAWGFVDACDEYGLEPVRVLQLPCCCCGACMLPLSHCGDGYFRFWREEKGYPPSLRGAGVLGGGLHGGVVGGQELPVGLRYECFCGSV